MQIIFEPSFYYWSSALGDLKIFTIASAVVVLAMFFMHRSTLRRRFAIFLLLAAFLLGGIATMLPSRTTVMQMAVAYKFKQMIPKVSPKSEPSLKYDVVNK